MATPDNPRLIVVNHVRRESRRASDLAKSFPLESLVA
jgi:hypothetical protein